MSTASCSLRARFAALPLLLAASVALPHAARAQSVPGYTVSTYATVTDPVLLSFGQGGVLYAGRDPTPAGSTTPVKVHRIGAGGSPVTELGNVAIADPDTILLDVAGTISGVPGTLLVAGLLGATPLPGRISGIHPDNTVVTLFETTDWTNIVEMKFDLTGRLVFTAVESRSIWVSTGGTPTILATLPGTAYPTYLSIDASNRIVVGGSDNKLRIYNADGTLANGSLATVGAFGGVEVGPGGAFGTDVYAIDSAVGTLVRVTGAGVKTTVGTGFGTGFATKDIAFGPDGALYVSVITADKVLRISSSPWFNLGSALAGVSGPPSLVGTGALLGGDPVTIALSNARPLSPVALIIGFSQINAPFKGGTLVPSLNILLSGLPTTAGGTLTLASTWPSGLPSNFPIYFQEWIADPAGPSGFSASNGLRATTP